MESWLGAYGYECSRQKEERHKCDDLHGDGFLLGFSGDDMHCVCDLFHAIGGFLGAFCVDSAGFNSAFVRYLVKLFDFSIVSA